MNFRGLICTGTALSVLALAGCGSDGGGSTAATTTTAKSSESLTVSNIKPCDLVTQAEAEAAYGGPLSAAKTEAEITPTCFFSSTGNAAIADNVQVQVQEAYIFDGTKKGANTAAVQSAFNIEPVSGIGEDAFFQSNKAQSDALNLILLGFKKKGVAIYISITKKGASNDTIKAGEKTLAQKVAGRL